MKWQKRLRLALALFAVIFVGVVAANYRKRPAQKVDAPVARTDAKAIAEGSNGYTYRLKGAAQEVRVDYERMLTYANNASKMLGVTITTERDKRVFVVKGKEASVGERESVIEVVGDVRIEASDGMVITTDKADYHETDGMTTAAGPVTFTRGRMTGRGTGFTYDKNLDILMLQNDATVHVDPDEAGAGAMDVASGSIEMRRNDHVMRFERTMSVSRGGEKIEADSGVAHLSPDEKMLEAMELRGQSRITMAAAAAGGLQALTGRDVDLKYRPGGEVLEHALVNGEAQIQLAGQGRQPGRQIAANIVDLSLGPDGATPTNLVAREAVRVSLPAEAQGVARTIAADLLESKGDDVHGLSTAKFSGNVQFTEKGPGVERAARALVLDTAVSAGFGAIDDARFAGAVRFVDRDMTATAANARYVPGNGTLELSGSEPASLRPHLVNPQIVIDAVKVDVTLDGPVIKAAGTVKSMLQPQKPGGAEKSAKLPSMLKPDQVVNVTAGTLDYDGGTNHAVYSGGAQLWQADTQIKSPRIVLDSDKGDLQADGPVATVSVMQSEDKDGKKQRERTTGTANAFKYQDSDRRATYTGDAHLSGPAGDMTSPRIELYLKPSGDELERVEAYEAITLRGDNRKTTGIRLTYFGDESRYVVTGAPVTIVDQCGGETTGRTLTFFRNTDQLIVDGKDGRGNPQMRTQTKGTNNCPGS